MLIRDLFLCEIKMWIIKIGTVFWVLHSLLIGAIAVAWMDGLWFGALKPTQLWILALWYKLCLPTAFPKSVVRTPLCPPVQSLETGRCPGLHLVPVIYSSS